jgi:hypothetical protein
MAVKTLAQGETLPCLLIAAAALGTHKYHTPQDYTTPVGPCGPTMALEPGGSGEGLSVQRENCALFLSKNSSDGSSGKEVRGNEGIFVSKVMIGVIYRNGADARGSSPSGN